MLSVTLLQAGLVVLATLCSIFVELMQVQCLHYCHETCRKEQVCVPSVQSQDLLVVGRLGDMTFKLKRCYRTFEFKSHVGYSRTLSVSDVTLKLESAVAPFEFQSHVSESYYY